MRILDKFFSYPYLEGGVRIFDDESCYYVDANKLRKILLEELNATKYVKINLEAH